MVHPAHTSSEVKIWHRHALCVCQDMDVIVIESAAYRQLRQEILEEVRVFLTAWAATEKQHKNDTAIWLRPDEARTRLHVKSRKKMQELRRSGKIHYLKNGREYLYDKESIDSYMLIQSTKKYSIAISKNSKSQK